LTGHANCFHTATPRLSLTCVVPFLAYILIVVHGRSWREFNVSHPVLWTNSGSQ